MLLIGFVLTLGILIVAHEYGHYRVAKWCGVKVLRFSIGFGRVVWRFPSRPGGTEFVLSAIPFGGYVRWWDSRTESVPAHDVPYAFDRRPLWQRAAIVLAGPLTNLLLAVLFYAASHWVGTVEPRAVIATPPAQSLAREAGLLAGDLIEAVAVGEGEWIEVASLPDLGWQVTQAAMRGEDLNLRIGRPGSGQHRLATLRLSALGGVEIDADTIQRIGLGAPFREPRIASVTPRGPADVAGVRAGDLVLSIDERTVADAQALLDRVRAHASRDAPSQRWLVERAGQRVALEVMPRLVTEGGATFGRVDAPIGAQPEMTEVRLGLVEGLSRGLARTWDMSALSLKMMGRMLIGEASLKNLSGPLTIGDYGGRAIQLGLGHYLGFLAMVSVSLGVLNLLPLPMLDGGHLMYYLFEGVTGRPVPDLWQAWLQRGGVLLLLLMMSIALSNDLARFLGLQ